MKFYLAVPVIAFALAGCIEKEAGDDGFAKAVSAVSEVKINAESPDMAVKSWWRLRDAEIALDNELCQYGLKRAKNYSQKVSELSTEEIFTGPRCPKSVMTFDRKITNVEVQSDTRAVVTAQITNTTAPEDGASLDYDDRKAKEQGDPFRYVLEREGKEGKWKISQVLNMPSYARKWEEVFKQPAPLNNRWVYENYQ
ncbi:hypothetical protein [Pseudomonas sp. NPDC089396]|uniref:hypothetical protein n=1 Tax=Pseudomonas sp. NPDC089396 TaxID=3364461 RepID=UPI003835A96E